MRGHGLAHTEKCRKFREQKENLKMDIEELVEEIDVINSKNEKLKKEIEKLLNDTIFPNTDENMRS